MTVVTLGEWVVERQEWRKRQVIALQVVAAWTKLLAAEVERTRQIQIYFDR